MRALLSFSAFGACLFVLPMSSGNGQTYVDRSSSCVAVIKRLNPGTHIRSGLTENKCPLSSPETAYSGQAYNSFVASGADCETEIQIAPACGLTANFLDVLPGSVHRILLPGGKCLHVLPVMLTDKTDGFKCNATKARPACVRNVREENGATVVTLAGGTAANALSADIIIPADPKHHVPLMAKSTAGPLMALVPADVTIAGDTHDSAGFIQHYVDHTTDICQGTKAYCREQAGFQVDRAMGELMRRVWNPRPLVPKTERDADFKGLIDGVLGGNLGRNDREKKLFAKLIIENEVSASSPYQILDAVIRNSGVSWGAHQIDIGANDGSEVTLFWDTLRRWRKAPGTGDYPKLRAADAQKVCMSQPIRSYFVDHIALLYDSVQDMNKGFRSDLGKASYDARFKSYLDEEVSRALALKGLFKKSPFAWLYFIDQRNQRGPSVGDALKAIGTRMDTDTLSTCDGVINGEGQLVAAIKARTDASDHYDIDRRVANLRKLLKTEYGQGQGRTCEE